MIAEQTENQVLSEVITACDHLVGNLYFNLGALPLMAGKLHPDDMPDCNARIVYTEMCRLHISPAHKLSAGTLEAALKSVGFDFKYLSALQSRVCVDSLDVLEDYAATVINWANVQAVKQTAMQVMTEADKPGARAEQLLPMMMQTPQAQQSGGLRDISEYGNELLADIDAWERGDTIEGLSTGFAALERFFRLERQRLYLIAARPSMGKCLGKGTKVLMYDGTLKAVEDVQVGDQLMGPDSTPRNVLSLARGREMMYWIRQKHGVDYRVNESHILSLKRSKNEGKWRNGDVYNVPVSEIKDKGPGFFHRFKGYKAAVDFLEIPLPIEPYFFGLWLGDGCTTNANIYNTDIEVISHLHEFAESRQEYVRVADKDRACRKFLVTGGRTKAARDSSIQASLNRLGVLGNKHIPEQYLRNSKSNRLQLLAGLIDSDGHYLVTQHGPYEITTKIKALAEQIKFLCDSLGYRTSLNAKIARSQNGYECTVYRVRFNGNVDEIPVKIERKKAAPWTDFRDWTLTAIAVEPDVVDDYYGFVIDGDHLFLLEDMTVAHNTSLAMEIGRKVAKELQDNEERGCVAVFSAEMSGKSLVLRMAAATSGINAQRVKNGEAEPGEYAGIRQAVRENNDLGIKIDESASPSPEGMYYKLAMINAICPIKLVIFDFIELGNPDRKTQKQSQNEEQRVSAIAVGLKNVAKQMDVPVIALSQLSRDVEKRADKLPVLADLRYSGMLEQIADVVLFVMRPEYYLKRNMTCYLDETYGPVEEGLKHPHGENVAYVSVAKQRDGNVGIGAMHFTERYTRFADLEMQRTEVDY